MKRFTLAIALVAFIFAFAPLRSASAKDAWISVRSKNFHLVGNASEKDIRRIGLQLEQFRDVLSRLIANVKAVSSAPVTVVVFKSDDAFKPFRPKSAAAYFQSGEDVNYIALASAHGDENPYAAIFHEYVHFLIKNNTENMPLWFNEGLAEYYSSFEIMDGDKKVLIGKPVSSHVRYLREHKLLPLETLFAVTLDSPIYNEIFAKRKESLSCQYRLLKPGGCSTLTTRPLPQAVLTSVTHNRHRTVLRRLARDKSSTGEESSPRARLLWNLGYEVLC